MKCITRNELHVCFSPFDTLSDHSKRQGFIVEQTYLQCDNILGSSFTRQGSIILAQRTPELPVRGSDFVPSIHAKKDLHKHWTVPW
jgi:hypothetical protein